MKISKVCSICNKLKTLNKSSWYANNECSACRARDRYLESGRYEYKVKWRAENKEHCNKRNRNYIRKKMESDPAFKIKKHLEDQFQEGMSWDNYGFYGWHIDHIKPLADFDLTDEKQFKEACHYTNLQPLWAEDNFDKGGKSGI